MIRARAFVDRLNLGEVSLYCSAPQILAAVRKYLLRRAEMHVYLTKYEFGNRVFRCRR
jgi:hypothetical protein